MAEEVSRGIDDALPHLWIDFTSQRHLQFDGRVLFDYLVRLRSQSTSSRG